MRVVRGRVWHVAVDLRTDSPSYKKWHALELSAENRRMLYLPPGFAHGLLTLSEEAEVAYKCTAEYDKSNDGGLRWDDPELAIDWPFRNVILSRKDATLPYLKELL